jgi:hypothetical protein
MMLSPLFFLPLYISKTTLTSRGKPYYKTYQNIVKNKPLFILFRTLIIQIKLRILQAIYRKQ